MTFEIAVGLGSLSGLCVLFGFFIGGIYHKGRYWDGYSRGYATAEADLNGLNGTVVRVEE